MKWSVSAGTFLAILAFTSCSTQQPTSTVPTNYTEYQLEYRLFAEFPDVFWSDPDLYPVAREGQELQNALQQFVNVRANDVEFSAILEHLRLDRKDNYTNEEKLLIYRQHKLLTLSIDMQLLAPGKYRFMLRVGEGQGERIEGTITAAGKVTIEKREPSFNTHPICLIAGTLIATPAGDIPVEDIRVGTVVWTVDQDGERVPLPVIRTSATDVSATYRALSVTLDDGRTVIASPGHPSGEGKPLGDYRVGDWLDGALVASVCLTPYTGTRTYDLLPEGATGLYWAGGILLKSTLGNR